VRDRPWRKLLAAGDRAEVDENLAEAADFFLAGLRRERGWLFPNALGHRIELLIRGLIKQARYGEAEALSERFLAALGERFEPRHDRVASELLTLAGLRYVQGKDAETQKLYQWEVADFYGHRRSPEHRLAWALAALCRVFLIRGQDVRLEPVLDGRARPRVPDDVDLEASVQHLAQLYAAAGKPGEGVELARRALAAVENLLGPCDQRGALALEFMGDVCQDHAQRAAAEACYRRAVAVQEAALGPDHPDVAATLYELTVMLRGQRRFAEAEALCRRALAVWEKAGAPHQEASADALNTLADLCRLDCRHAEATALFRQGLAVREAALGPDHPRVAVALTNFGLVCRQQGEFAEGEQILRRALAILEAGSPDPTPALGQCLSHLGALTGAWGRLAEAASLLERSARVLDGALNVNPAARATTRLHLSQLYRVQGRLAEARQHCDEARTVREQALGPDHPDTVLCLLQLAGIARDDAKLRQNPEPLREAEVLTRRFLEAAERAQGPDHINIALGLGALSQIHT
jgi:tetratricopeptide (TPR) repeat protein